MDCVGLWAPWTGHNKVTVAAGRWVADRSLVYLRRKERGARFRPPDSCYRTSYTCLCQGAGLKAEAVGWDPTKTSLPVPLRGGSDTFSTCSRAFATAKGLS